MLCQGDISMHSCSSMPEKLYRCWTADEQHCAAGRAIIAPAIVLNFIGTRV